jgi:cytochrome c-type biogenesis protein CcsB
MTGFELMFVWAAVAFYAASFLSFLTGLVFQRPRLSDWGGRFAAAALVFHTGGIVVRWVVTGHLPVMAAYENSLTGTWFVVVSYFIMRGVLPLSKPFGVGVMPLVLLILGNGLQQEAVLQPLEPAYRSFWLYIHVLFAWFAFGPFVSAFAAGVLYILKDWGRFAVFNRLPDLKLLDEVSLRLILLGFFAEAIMIASGAIWAHGLWGRYWGWDPVETWSLVSWLMYGVALHLRITLGWRGRRGAWLAIIALLGVIFVFFGFGYVSNLHTGIF